MIETTIQFLRLCLLAELELKKIGKLAAAFAHRVNGVEEVSNDKTTTTTTTTMDT